MAILTGATAVAERPTESLLLATLPAARADVTRGRQSAVVALSNALPIPGAHGVLSGLPGVVTEMVVGDDGRTLVAACYGEGTVSVVDLNTLTVRASCAGVDEPYALAAAGDRVYVSSAALSADSVIAIDTAAGVPLAAREITSRARGIAVSPTGDVLYVARGGEDTADIAVIDVESGDLSGIPVSDAADASVDTVRLNNDGTRLFAGLTTAAGGALLVIDVATRRVLHTVPVAGSIGDIAVHRDGRKVFATGRDDERGSVVSVIDTAAGRVTASVEVSGLATQVIAGANRAYVVHGDQIAIVNTATSTIVDSIDVGWPVSCVAIGRDEASLYVADFDGAVSTVAVPGTGNRLRAAS
jgi:DNA-binding beta-propeller fold protein YncE